MENMFKTPVLKFSGVKQGQAGFDNPRENIDPHIKTTAISTKEIIGNSFDIGTADSSTKFYLTNWNSGAGTFPHLLMRKSRGGAVGTYGTTVDTDTLGIIQGYGVNAAADSFVRGPAIYFVQTGAAAAFEVPSEIRFYTDARPRLNITHEGLVYFWYDGSLPLGSLYAHEAAINVDISTVGQGVYVKVTGLTTGCLNGVTINSDAFNVPKTGIYKIDWQISADSQGANKTYECDIFVNGVEQHDGSSRRKFAAAGDQGSFSGTAIIEITDTAHDIDLRIKEPGVGAGTDIDILHLNFNIVMLGS